jgi:glycosyltransferase involved in cell wall biosynthesis
MEKVNLHCLAVPHTVTHPDYVACAFTQKVLKFLEMFKDHPEYHTIHYGHPASVTSAHEHVNVTNDEILQQTYGNYDWRKNQFRHNSEDLAHKVFNVWAAKVISEKKKRGDLVLAFWGGTAEACSIANKDNDLIVVEPGIGSAGAFAKFRCYESYPLRAAFVGTAGVARCYPEWYWRVVPNYFDLTNFSPDLPKEDYAVFIGRLGVNKGLDLAIDACGRMGIKLKVAGQGGPEGIGLKEWPAHVEFVGYADMEARRELMGRAKFGFLLSTYWEPFGGTAVEMMLSGCVPILSDMGAMTEYCVDGLNGFRCNTMGDILRAIRMVDTIDRKKMTQFAQDNFSLDNVRPKFERAFNDFRDVFNGKGWYEDHNRNLNVGLGLNYKSLYV